FVQMERQESSTEIFEKFTWKIDNFSRLTVDKIYSEPFVIGGYPWRILLFPKGNKVDDYVSIYLEAVKTANMAKEWSRDVKFKLLVFNQLDTNKTITKEVFVCKSTLEKPVNQASNLIVSLASGSQNGHMKVEVTMPNPEVEDPNLETISPVSSHIDAELFSPSIEELMDFSTLGQLEEVCSDTPSLIECPQKRSRKFNDLAFAALGRVLYFLKTRKVKDMNEQACKDLQVLWDELQKFKYDLTWLEPHVQYALGMKSYVEKALQLEKLKENMVALELETERLKVKCAAGEVNLHRERDLLKAKGFEERDLESELGYGSWRP
ncbi:ubiquitin carboxyl-terminal hydrolase family protein, partial [Trifolium medium]|nr:ubiquitin carboxyl-terminal hydrolase family protein [Trifolium medium]